MMTLQTLLVLITFLVAAGYLLNKFILSPILEKKKRTTPGTIDGGKTKCGNDNCGCH